MRWQVCLIAVSAFTTSATSAAAKETPLYQPVKSWNLNYSGTDCQLSRSFSNGSDQKQLIIYAWPVVNRGDILLVSLPDKQNEPRLTRGSLQLGTMPAKETDVIIFDAQPEGRKVQLYDMPWNFAALAVDDALPLKIRDDRGNAVSIPIKDGKAAIAALEKCRDALGGRWGLKLKEQTETVLKPAEPLAIETWFSSIPQPAGIVKALWQIDLDGHISNCHVLRGSGSITFDRTVCSTLMKYARYKPALDKSSQPVVSYDMRVFRFGLQR